MFEAANGNSWREKMLPAKKMKYRAAADKKPSAIFFGIPARRSVAIDRRNEGSIFKAMPISRSRLNDIHHQKSKGPMARKMNRGRKSRIEPMTSPITQPSQNGVQNQRGCAEQAEDKVELRGGPVERDEVERLFRRRAVQRLAPARDGHRQGEPR